MIHPAYPVGECSDRLVVGDVDGLSADVGVAVGTGEFRLIASGHNDPGTL
jgi:hypothetical protein